MKNKHRRIILIAGLFATIFGCLVSCDTLQEDSPAPTPSVSSVVKQVYLLPNSDAFVDMRMIAQSAGNAVLQITSQPRQGTLSEVATGLLQYTPNKGFTSGRDAFTFSLNSTNGNKRIGQDSISIIVPGDTSGLPCGVYPRADYAQITGPYAFIDVLANDVLCHGPNSTKLIIYRPDNSFPPYSGSATIENHKIKYTPGPNFSGKDKIMYKVMDAADTTKYGFAIAYITTQSLCNFSLNDDSFSFTGTGSLFNLDVFANDVLCTNIQNDYSFTIIDRGRIGQAEYGSQTALAYRVPSSVTNSFADTVRYQVCYDGVCKSAKAIVTITR